MSRLEWRKDWEEVFDKLLRDGVISAGMEECGDKVHVFIRRPGKPPPNEVRFVVPQVAGSRLRVGLFEDPPDLAGRVAARMDLAD